MDAAITLNAQDIDLLRDEGVHRAILDHLDLDVSTLAMTWTATYLL
jgi:hypothetical protein